MPNANEELKTYEIEVCRESRAYCTIEAQGTSYKDACAKAIEMAGDFKYSDEEVAYIIES